MKKDSSNLLTGLSIFLTASGGFLSVDNARAGLVEQTGLSDATLLLLSRLSLVFGFILLLAMFVNKINREKERTVSRLSAGQSRRHPAFHLPLPATCSEVLVFHQMLLAEFGEEEVAPLDRWFSWHWRNPEAIEVVVRINLRTRAQKIVGGFKMVPIDDTLASEIESGKFTSGAAIPAEHIVQPGATAAAWWLGNLLSISERNDPFVMRGLRDFFEKNVRAGTTVYARPLKEHGLCRTREFGFVTVGDHREPEMGRVCALYAQDVNGLLERLYANKPSRRRSKRGIKVTRMGSLPEAAPGTVVPS